MREAARQPLAETRPRRITVVGGMTKTCFIYANCQARGLANLLSLSRDFSSRYRIETFSNWEALPFPASRLNQCDLLIYQPTRRREGLAPSTDEMRATLGPRARTVSFAYLYFNGLWPFHTRSPVAEAGKDLPCERHYYADTLLDRLSATELPARRIVNIYLRFDFVKEHDVRAAVDASIALQRRKEEHVDIASFDIVAALQDKRRLFLTVRHPTNELYLHLANRILRRLGFAELPAAAAALAPSPYAVAYEHPVHPGIAEALRLRWLAPDVRYPIWDDLLTYAEYLHDYIAFRRRQQAAALDAARPGVLALINAPDAATEPGCSGL
jgi:hypothetical protein